WRDFSGCTENWELRTEIEFIRNSLGETHRTVSVTGTLWLTEPADAVTVMMYVPGVVPGWGPPPPPPPPPPSSPPPQAICNASSAPKLSNKGMFLRRAPAMTPIRHNPPAGIQSAKSRRWRRLEAVVGALVAIVRVTEVWPLLAATWVGLNEQVVLSGKFVHAS